jgi:hypothetical protein
MLEESLGTTSPVLKIAAPIIAAVVIAGAGVGYAVHEHSAAQKASLQSEKAATELSLTQGEIGALTTKVNELEANNAARQAEAAAQERSSSDRTRVRRVARPDPRFGKLQTQLDAQGKRLDAEDQEIADARNDLTNTRTELTGSIAKTHDELVVLEKKGQRNYFEFDLTKSKEFKREGPVGISLRKANEKHGYADLMLMVDDRNLQTKHVNLFQPSMFYEPDRPQPIEIVINEVTKNHIHGYVSAPKYRNSELDAMSNQNAANGTQQAANTGAGDNGIVGEAPTPGENQATDSNTQPTLRQRTPQPSNQPNQQ